MQFFAVVRALCNERHMQLCMWFVVDMKTKDKGIECGCFFLAEWPLCVTWYVWPRNTAFKAIVNMDQWTSRHSNRHESIFICLCLSDSGGQCRKSRMWDGCESETNCHCKSHHRSIKCQNAPNGQNDGRSNCCGNFMNNFFFKNDQIYE